MTTPDPLTLLIASYVLPAAVTAYSAWLLYVGAAERLCCRKGRRKR